MPKKYNYVNIIGGGPAGIECALFLAAHDIKVHIFDFNTPAPVTINKISSPENPVASLLRKELEILGSVLLKKELEFASQLQGDCLYYELVSYGRQKLKENRNIEFFPLCIKEINFEELTVVCCGNKICGLLFDNLKSLLGSMRCLERQFSFPVISLEEDKLYIGLLPLSYENYIFLCNNIIKEYNHNISSGKEIKLYKDTIESLVLKGKDELRNSIMRQTYIEGLSFKPYAVLRTRKRREGFTLEGFSSALPAKSQYRIITSIKGLEEAVVLNSSVEKNEQFINSPFVIDFYGKSKINEKIFFAGGVVGIKGHLECMASGLYTGYNVLNTLRCKRIFTLPSSVIGKIYAELIKIRPEKFMPFCARYDIIDINRESDLEGLSRYVKEMTNGIHI